MTDYSEYGEPLCMAPSKAKWNFVRTYYCSKRAGHTSPHMAWMDHIPMDELQYVAWFGPWRDGTYYDAPNWTGIEPWQPPNTNRNRVT